MDEMTAGSLFSSQVLLLRGGSWEKKLIKMHLFPFLQPVHSCEENEILIFLKFSTTNFFFCIYAAQNA